jgi:hypothetical protein
VPRYGVSRSRSLWALAVLSTSLAWSLAAGRPGTSSEGLVYLLFEGGTEGMYSGIHLARFNLAWVLEGEATAPSSPP